MILGTDFGEPDGLKSDIRHQFVTFKTRPITGRIDSEVDLPLDADSPFIALLPTGTIVHIVVGELLNNKYIRGEGDGRPSINDPGIIFHRVDRRVVGAV